MPYNPELRIFQNNHLAQTMRPSVLYNHAKNWKDPQGRFGEKNKKDKKLFFRPLNPLLEKPSGSNNVPYCPLQSCKIMKILKAVLHKKAK